jgi:P2-related tail formation protein
MTGQARSSGLRFFLDRGLGSKLLPTALRQAGWQLETMDERYGKVESQVIQDAKWIQEATLNGDVILCKDLKIASNPLEAQVVFMTSARVFGLASAQLTGPKMINWYLWREAEIVEMAQRANGPFVASVHAAQRLRRVRLAYPPA